jgi:hypothetical protein
MPEAKECHRIIRKRSVGFNVVLSRTIETRSSASACCMSTAMAFGSTMSRRWNGIKRLQSKEIFWPKITSAGCTTEVKA